MVRPERRVVLAEPIRWQGAPVKRNLPRHEAPRPQKNLAERADLQAAFPLTTDEGQIGRRPLRQCWSINLQEREAKGRTTMKTELIVFFLGSGQLYLGGNTHAGLSHRAGGATATPRAVQDEFNPTSAADGSARPVLLLRHS